MAMLSCKEKVIQLITLEKHVQWTMDSRIAHATES